MKGLDRLRSETLQQPTLERSRMPTALAKSLRRTDVIGTCVRCSLMTLVLLVVVLFAFGVREVFSLSIPFRFLAAISLIVLVSMLAASVVSEYPRGDDYLMMRLGFATFCRTGLPLLVVMIVARYSEPTFANETFGFLVAFYAVGLVTNIRLSLYSIAHPANEYSVTRG